jgi:hypothetical protein
MFEKAHAKKGKFRLMVRLCLNDGRAVEGEVFLMPGERLTDLLNDERAFLPIERGEAVSAIAKNAILSADPLAAEPEQKNDPYKVLRVDPEASDAEVKRAWMNRLKATHPDRLIALGMDDLVVYAARKAASHVNAAYDEIRARRKAAAAAA